MKTVSLYHLSTFEEFPIEQNVFLGRGRDCSIRVRDGRVSSKHLRLERNDDGKAFITDLDTQNGSFLNDQLILPLRTYPIQEGDIIRLVGEVFLFERAGLYRSEIIKIKNGYRSEYDFLDLGQENTRESIEIFTATPLLKQQFLLDLIEEKCRACSDLERELENILQRRAEVSAISKEILRREEERQRIGDKYAHLPERQMDNFVRAISKYNQEHQNLHKIKILIESAIKREENELRSMELIMELEDCREKISVTHRQRARLKEELLKFHRYTELTLLEQDLLQQLAPLLETNWDELYREARRTLAKTRYKIWILQNKKAKSQSFEVA